MAARAWWYAKDQAIVKDDGYALGEIARQDGTWTVVKVLPFYRALEGTTYASMEAAETAFNKAVPTAPASK